VIDQQVRERLDLDAIKAQNPLDVTVERLTGQQIEHHKVTCPFHSNGNESSPSLHVYDDGGWKCFSCGKHGDLLDFVGYYYFGSAYNPHTHLIDVVDRLGALDIRPAPQQASRPKPKPQLAITQDTLNRWNAAMQPEHRAYWRSRGISDDTQDTFLLGWDGERLTIPATYRGIVFGVKRRMLPGHPDGQEAKYVSTPGSRVGIFNADILWMVPPDEPLIICEGEVDAMSLYQAGQWAISSTGGAASWREHWAEFVAHIPRIYVVYDNDKPGQEGALKVRGSIYRARILTLPEAYNDVNEFFTADNTAALDWLRMSLNTCERGSSCTQKF
jgi:DNA primase